MIHQELFQANYPIRLLFLQHVFQQVTLMEYSFIIILCKDYLH